MEIPTRPDVEGVRASGVPGGARLRPPFVGAAAALASLLGAFVAVELLGAYPPPNADLILFAGAIIWGALATLIALAAQRGWLSLVALCVVGSLVPLAMAAWVPGVAQPRQHLIPGAPTLAVTAAPDGTMDLYVLPQGNPEMLVQVTDGGLDERFASLSPDGDEVSFTVLTPDGGGEVWVYGFDEGWNVTSRSLLEVSGSFPRSGGWSPDGRAIVERLVDGVPTVGLTEVATGLDEVHLPDADMMSFSPDGDRITFIRHGDEDGWAIWVADADGSDAQMVADTPGDDLHPRFSPDGRTIAFTSVALGSSDVWTVGIDGAAARNVTPDTASSTETVEGWSPEGHVLFLSDRSGTGGIFLYFMEADGTNVRLALRL